jgi:hypothetical protein
MTSLPFHKLIEIQAIFPQLTLHIFQSFFVRIRSSKRHVNTCWKEKTYLVIVKFMRIARLYSGDGGKAHGSTAS